MKRMKVPDYKEKSVFGVPLIVHVQRCGFPLPLCLQQALSHLRTHCLDQVREKNSFHKTELESNVVLTVCQLFYFKYGHNTNTYLVFIPLSFSIFFL